MLQQRSCNAFDNFVKDEFFLHNDVFDPASLS